MSENVDRYESIVLVASGFGIAAAIPYLKKLVYSSTCWHLEREECILSGRLRLSVSILISGYRTLTCEDIAIAVQVTLNSLLEDDILKKCYVSSIFLAC